MITKITGELEIDHDRGVISFRCSDPNIVPKFGVVPLRICRLPKPIPEQSLDITHMTECDWTGAKFIKRLSRVGKWPIVTHAVLREDGVHFVEHDGKERKYAEYKSVEEMNTELKRLGFDTFE